VLDSGVTAINSNRIKGKKNMNRARLLLLAVTLIASFATRVDAQMGIGRPTAGIFGGITTPRGDFSDEVGNGWHAGVMAKLRVYGALDVRVDGTYARLGKKSVDVQLSNGDTIVFHTDASVPFGTVGLSINLGPDSAEYPGDNTVSPHILGGVGMYQLDYKLTCEGAACAGFETVPKDTHIGFNFGGGATIPIMGVRTFVEARYHRISRKAEDGDARTMITLSAGIKIR
jgi:hypothetical protein